MEDILGNNVVVILNRAYVKKKTNDINRFNRARLHTDGENVIFERDIVFCMHKRV